jgi:hypothetical protein
MGTLIRTKRESRGTPGFFFRGSALENFTADMIADFAALEEFDRTLRDDFDVSRRPLCITTCERKA